MWERKAISPRPKMGNKQSKFACKWGREQGYNKGWHATNCAGAVCSRWVKFIFEMLKNSDCFKNSKIHYFKVKNIYNYSEFFKCNQTWKSSKPREVLEHWHKNSMEAHKVALPLSSEPAKLQVFMFPITNRKAKRNRPRELQTRHDFQKTSYTLS